MEASCGMLFFYGIETKMQYIMYIMTVIDYNGIVSEIILREGSGE